MSRMRDKLIHHYAGVNLKILYETIENELPTLRKKMNKMIATLDAKEKNI